MGKWLVAFIWVLASCTAEPSSTGDVGRDGAVADAQPDRGAPDLGLDLGPASDGELPDAQPDADQPDADQPDAEQPDAQQPDAQPPDAHQPDASEPDPGWTLAGSFNDWNPAAPGGRLRRQGPHFVGEVDLPLGPIEFKFARDGAWDGALGAGDDAGHLPRQGRATPGGANLRAEVPLAGAWRVELEPDGDFRFQPAAPVAGPLGELLAAIERGEAPAGLRSPVVTPGAAVWFSESPGALASEANDWAPNRDLLVASAGPLHYIARPLLERTAYKYVADGVWRSDPANPHVEWDGIPVAGVGAFNSVAWPAGWAFDAPYLTRHVLPPPFGPRDLFLWRPSSATAGLPWVLVHDGNESITRGHFDEVLTAATQAGRLPPVVVAFLALRDQRERFAEYGLPVADPDLGDVGRGDDYVDGLVEHVLGFVEAEAQVSRDRDDRAILGASLGGLISVYAAWLRPEVWRRAGAQSGSFFWGERWLIEQIRGAERRDLVFYLDSGEPADNAVVTRELAAVLRDKGYPLVHVETPGGQHDWAFWAARFEGAIAALLREAP